MSLWFFRDMEMDEREVVAGVEDVGMGVWERVQSESGGSGEGGVRSVAPGLTDSYVGRAQEIRKKMENESCVVV